ncbi:MAG: response regulator [Candidatus Eremiobacterota bacterium]
MENKKILIADDEQALLELYKSIFEEANSYESSCNGFFAVNIFNDGLYLLEYFIKEYNLGHRIPLCILDMKMHIMNGLETARELRRIDGDVIIVLITAYAHELSFEEIKESLNENIYYLKKPFSHQELFCLVDSLVKSWNKNDELNRYRNSLEELVVKRTEEVLKVNETLKEEMAERIKTESLLLSTFDSIDDIIVVIDRNMNIVMSNWKAKEYMKERIIYKHCYKLLRNLDEPCKNCRVKEIFNSGGSMEFEYSDLIHGRTMEIRDYPVFDKELNTVLVVKFIRDITEKVKLQNQLLQSQKMEALGTLAGGIAHDFNNILGSIFINTELVMDDIGEDIKSRKNLEEILIAANRATDLVRQILSFTRKKEYQLKPVLLSPVIKEALKLIRATLPSTIEIKQHIDSSGVIMGDPSHIHQILMNLCTNAFYAMKENGGILTVSLDDIFINSEEMALYENLKEGPHIKLSVSDTGYGIDSSIKERIFEPYFTTKRAGDGTGLGLSVVSGIIQAYRGEIKVFSHPGEGSVFHVYFPAVVSEREKIDEKSVMVKGGKETLLLVDDEEFILHGMKDMLEKLGYNIVATTNSAEALNMFQAEPDRFDLIITDQTMPELPGHKLVGEIMQIRPDLPVILCTGFSDIINSDNYRSAGIREFLMKPVNIKTLAGIIRKLLDEREVVRLYDKDSADR